MAQVSDYNIANASGASVRSDLNAVFSAIKTLNSGGSDPSNTEAFMPYVDTADNNTLKIRNSANNGFTEIGPVNTANLGLLPRSGGTMTGVLALPNQTAANPSVHFGDATTGFFRKASNQIGVAASGTEQLFLDQDGITLNLQNEVRFGDANSSHYAAIKAPATISTNFTLTLPVNDGNNGEFLKTDGSGNLSFASATTSLNNLNASNLTSGTIPNARFPSSLPAISGANLTNLDASDLSSGTIPDARFPSTLPAVSGANLTNINGASVKVFVTFNGRSSGTNKTILASDNVSSVTDNAAGDYTINFTNTLADQHYTPVTMALANDTQGTQGNCNVRGNTVSGSSTKTSSACRILVGTSSGNNLFDKQEVFFAALR